MIIYYFYLKDKAATVATIIISATLYAVAFYFIVQGASTAVSWINSYVDTVSNAKESSEALTQKMKDFNSTVDENAKIIESLNSKYHNLSEGVKNLGENVSLSTSEYE